jgi:hypothetical protein
MPSRTARDRSQPPDTYWGLLAQVGRLQAKLGEDLVAWAKVYESGGDALQRSGGTLQEMADVGQRMEQLLLAGPPGAAAQVMRMFAGPFGVPGLAPGTGTASGPFLGLWEAWLSGQAPTEGPPPGPPPTTHRAR